MKKGARAEFGARNEEEALRTAHALVAELIDEYIRGISQLRHWKQNVPAADKKRLLSQLALIAAFHHEGSES